MSGLSRQVAYVASAAGPETSSVGFEVMRATAR
jgi:hypothetical protein